MMSIKLFAVVGMILLQVSTGSRISTSDLDADPVSFDGQIVTVTGEIVGDYGRRSNVVWVQVNDDGYGDRPLVETGELTGQNTGVGVRIPKDLFDEGWGRPGGYRTRGPIVEVTGIFRYADVDTGGDTFIEAAFIDLIEPSRPMDAPSADWALTALSAVALVAGAAMWARARWRRLNPEA
jgi:hypothetical protein